MMTLREDNALADRAALPTLRGLVLSRVTVAC
jgi:hypothetical protein